MISFLHGKHKVSGKFMVFLSCDTEEEYKLLVESKPLIEKLCGVMFDNGAEVVRINNRLYANEKSLRSSSEQG